MPVPDEPTVRTLGCEELTEAKVAQTTADGSEGNEGDDLKW